MMQFLRIKCIALLATWCYIVGAFAYVDGEIYSESGPYVFNLKINDSSFPENTPGDYIIENYSTIGSIIAKCYNTTGKDIGDGNTPVYFSTVTDLPVAPGGGYMLNDYVKLDTEIFLAGEVQQFVSTPWLNVSNKGHARCPKNGGFAIDDWNGSTFSLGTGSKGKFKFTLTKPIINGLNINDVHVLDVVGRIGTVTSNVPTSLISRVYIQSFVVTVADKCIVNAGTPIQIEFGTIPNTNLAGDRFTQNVPVKVECDGGSFSQGNVSIAMAIQPGTGVSSFNPDYLATDKQNLGISLKQTSDGRNITPGQFYKLDNFDTASLRGEWDLIAAPVNNPGTSVTEGEFSASSTIVMEFQ